jgi:hypothetical protein
MTDTELAADCAETLSQIDTITKIAIRNRQAVLQCKGRKGAKRKFEGALVMPDGRIFLATAPDYASEAEAIHAMELLVQACVAFVPMPWNSSSKPASPSCRSAITRSAPTTNKPEP